jgi:phosphatidylserine decarboxylase
VAPGEELQAGQRVGIMKFGSRMDVFVPRSAELRVAPGDIVRGGETVIAVLH